MATLRSDIAAAGDAKAQGAALCAGLAAFVGPGSELEKTILEAFKLSTETVHPDAESDAGEACAEEFAAMTNGLVAGVLACVRHALGIVASGPHKVAADRLEFNDKAAVVSLKKAELPPIASWTHPTRGLESVEFAAPWTNAEFRSKMDALAAQMCAADEALACHFTSNVSAHLILSDKSHGLRASTVGQLGGGVSLCLPLPPAMDWAPKGRDAFRPTVGRALWGEKAADVRLGGPDDDKLDVNCSTCCSSSR